MISVLSQQVLIPKKVYIGDTAELRCTFNSSLGLLNEATEKGSVNLLLSGFTEGLDLRDYEVKQLVLSRTGVNYYQLSVIFVPWKTGKITFPAFDVLQGLGAESRENQNVNIEFKPLEIVSIIENTGATSARGITAPLLLPGTAYKLYGAMAGFVILLIIAIRLIVRRKKLVSFVRGLKQKLAFRRNRKCFFKQLNTLCADKICGKEGAEQCQKAVRVYLGKRFAENFMNKTSTELRDTLCGLVEEDKKEPALQLSKFFEELDYVRYGNRDFSIEQLKAFTGQLKPLILKLDVIPQKKEEIPLQPVMEVQNV